jgi:hypothetical protein
MTEKFPVATNYRQIEQIRDSLPIYGQLVIFKKMPMKAREKTY